jgi:alkylation response protein AidB-like acyl-CoA dehydrogenase
VTHEDEMQAGSFAFRQRARSWLEASLDRRPTGSRGPLRSEEISPETVAAYRAFQRRLFDGGYAGVSVPVQYGGQGLGIEGETGFAQELAAFATPNPAGAWTLTHGPIARSMLTHAAPEFLREHIPPILSGERIWCQFYSEPEAGSDLAGIRTRATRDGSSWVLQGAKIWSTGASGTNEMQRECDRRASTRAAARAELRPDNAVLRSTRPRAQLDRKGELMYPQRLRGGPGG